MGRAGRSRRLSDGRLPFVALAAVVTAAAAGGVLPRWPGLVHLLAVPPLDLFADTRLLLTTAAGYPELIVGLLVALLVRIGILAAALGGRRRLGFAVRFYLAALGPALLAAQLHFVAQSALYSRLFWTAVILTVATAGVLTPAVFLGSERLRDALGVALRHGLRIWLVAGYLGALTVLGAAATAGGPAAAVAAIPLSAVLTLLARDRLSRPPEGSPLLAAAAGAACLALGVAAVVGTRGHPWPQLDDSRPGSLMVMSGINSASGEGAIFEMDPRRIGFSCDTTYYYSYAGPGDGQPRGDAACPIRTGAPYQPTHTQRPFDEQVELLAAQVRGLDPPVVVAAHSQAAWVAWAGLADGLLDDVDAVVLIGPFPDSPIGYPPPGQRGAGAVGGDGFRLLQPLAERVDFDFEVDAPLARELLASPDAASAVFTRPLPDDARALSVTATSDLPLMPDGWRIEGAIDACPVREAHPYLPLTPAFHDEVGRFLDGRPQLSCPTWRPVVRHLGRPYGVPPASR